MFELLRSACLTDRHENRFYLLISDFINIRSFPLLFFRMDIHPDAVHSSMMLVSNRLWSSKQNNLYLRKPVKKPMVSVRSNIPRRGFFFVLIIILLCFLHPKIDINCVTQNAQEQFKFDGNFRSLLLLSSFRFDFVWTIIYDFGCFPFWFVENKIDVQNDIAETVNDEALGNGTCLFCCLICPFFRLHFLFIFILFYHFQFNLCRRIKQRRRCQCTVDRWSG